MSLFSAPDQETLSSLPFTSILHIKVNKFTPYKWIIMILIIRINSQLLDEGGNFLLGSILIEHAQVF